jgi:hypothetical protein
MSCQEVVRRVCSGGLLVMGRLWRYRHDPPSSASRATKGRAAQSIGTPTLRLGEQAPALELRAQGHGDAAWKRKPFHSPHAPTRYMVQGRTRRKGGNKKKNKDAARPYQVDARSTPSCATG